MSKLDFNILQGTNCDKVTLVDCSTYCESVATEEKYLIASAAPSRTGWAVNAQGFTKGFINTSFSTGTITGVTWTVNGGTPIISASPYTTQLLTLVEGINEIEMTVGDNQSIGTSTITIIVELDSTGIVLSYYFPVLTIDPSSSPSVFFTAFSAVTQQNPGVITPSSVDLDTGDTDVLDLTPINNIGSGAHLYSGSDEYSLQLTYDLPLIDEYTAVYPFKLQIQTIDCTAELTQEGLSNTILTVVSPPNQTYTALLQNVTLTGSSPYTYKVYASDLKDSNNLPLQSFSKSGKWKFTVDVQKTEGGTTYSFQQTIYVYLICDILCKYGKLLLSATAQRCDCTAAQSEDIVNIGVLIEALKNAIACNKQSQADKLIELLEVMLAANGCGC